MNISKNVDIKSLLIGILLTSTVFLAWQAHQPKPAYAASKPVIQKDVRGPGPYQFAVATDSSLNTNLFMFNTHTGEVKREFYPNKPRPTGPAGWGSQTVWFDYMPPLSKLPLRRAK